MYPWLWFWAPQVHFPWSGAVSQEIAPNTSWFSDMIKPGAGDPEVERQAFDVASYGKQLGLLTNVLVDLAEQTNELSPAATKSLNRLREIKASIDAIKQGEREAAASRVVSEVMAMKERGGDDYQKVAQQLLDLLSSTAAK